MSTTRLAFALGARSRSATIQMLVLGVKVMLMFGLVRVARNGLFVAGRLR